MPQLTKHIRETNQTGRILWSATTAMVLDTLQGNVLSMKQGSNKKARTVLLHI